MDEDEYLIMRHEMDLQILEAVVLQMVTDGTGIKAVDLAVEAMRKTMPKTYEARELLSILDSLVNRGEIVELVYTIPNVPGRLKSIYFPKGTVFTHETTETT